MPHCTPSGYATENRPKLWFNRKHSLKRRRYSIVEVCNTFPEMPNFLISLRHYYWSNLKNYFFDKKNNWLSLNGNNGLSSFLICLSSYSLKQDVSKRGNVLTNFWEIFVHIFVSLQLVMSFKLRHFLDENLSDSAMHSEIKIQYYDESNTRSTFEWFYAMLRWMISRCVYMRCMCVCVCACDAIRVCCSVRAGNSFWLAGHIGNKFGLFGQNNYL